MLLDNVKISHKITGLSMGILLLVTVVFGLVAIRSLNSQGASSEQGFTDYAAADMVKYGEKLRSSHQERLLNLTDVATSSLQDLHQQVQSGNQCQRRNHPYHSCGRNFRGRVFFWRGVHQFNYIN